MEDERGAVDEVLLALYARPPLSNRELRYRIEPLQAHRAVALERLLAELDGASQDRDLAVAVLHEIALPQDAERLVAAMRDHGRSDSSRAEISQVLVGVAGDRLSSLLEPGELAELSLWSIEAFLDRLHDPLGREPAIETYRASTADERIALLEAIASTTEGPGAKVRLGAALDPLFPEEPEPRIRSWMIRRLSERPEAASARALDRWRSQCHGSERARLEEALRRLGRRGIRERAEGIRPLAWISGADATACFSVVVAFPSGLGLRDVLMACLSLETGLRTVSLLRAVGAETSQDIARALDEGQGIPVASLEVAAAVSLVTEARDRTVALGLPLPDGIALAASYLHRPLGVARRPSALEPRPVPPARLLGLLELPPYASWRFGPSEIPDPVGPSGDAAPGVRDASRRLRAAAERALVALEGRAVGSRLAAMLRHQSLVHLLRREHDLATRAAAAAREVESRKLSQSVFARRLMERSLAAAADRPERVPRSQVRDTFKRRLETHDRIGRHEVLVLDLAEALYREIESRSERATGRDRPTPPQMESLALRAGAECARELTRDSSEQATLPLLAAPGTASAAAVRRRLGRTGTRIVLEERLGALVGAETTLAPEPAHELARALTTVALWFAGEICLSRCRRGCLLEPAADGRALFFAPEHPAGIDSVAEENRAERSAASVALELALARRLDAAIARQAGFLDVLPWLGLAPQGEDRARFERAGECLRRLRAVRSTLEQAGEDPALVYSCVEEAESIEQELAGLRRRLFSAVVGRLEPRAEQFGRARPGEKERAAWHRFDREMRKLGLLDLPLLAVQAALDRFETSAPFLTLLQAVAPPRTVARRRLLAERLRELWNHTPRSSLGGRTPAETSDGPG